MNVSCSFFVRLSDLNVCIPEALSNFRKNADVSDPRRPRGPLKGLWDKPCGGLRWEEAPQSWAQFLLTWPGFVFLGLEVHGPPGSPGEPRAGCPSEARGSLGFPLKLFLELP